MTENEDILIQKYLNGELNADQELEFRNALLKDERLRRNLELIKNVQHAIKNDPSEFKEKVKHIFTKKQNHYIIKWSLFTILTILIFFFIYKTKIDRQPLDHSKIYAEYFEPYPDNITTRNEGDNTKLAKLLAAYSENDYQLINFEELLLNYETHSDTIIFFLANALMVEKRYIEAQTILEKSDFKQSIYQIQSQYYLGLIYLKLGDISKARDIFLKLSNNPSNQNYALKSKIILTKL